jgi:hypothetical protein
MSVFEPPRERSGEGAGGERARTQMELSTRGPLLRLRQRAQSVAAQINPRVAEFHLSATQNCFPPLVAQIPIPLLDRFRAKIDHAWSREHLMQLVNRIDDTENRELQSRAMRESGSMDHQQARPAASAAGERSLGGGHVAAVVGDLAEPGHAPQVDLGAVPEGDDDVAPLADEPRHDRHGRDGGVGEVGAVGAGEAGDDGDAAGREAVAQDEGARHGRQRQRQPQQGQAEEQVRRQVAVVRAAVEEHRLGSRVRGGDGESGTRGL